ncbi:sperm acrosome membrane-associated protein 4-like isoform X1 [Synchiropus splendidus]|uniref:sperm acrosome membrane-associated protein 4-like isoform X1 n=1 Tax=Synchiropus splendidus TaxID=270530 RepID=UPI00237E88C3|nr:sperm acrosome membrane-associated protein 4-like isoform X1 [Synchiropus splendidus]
MDRRLIRVFTAFTLILAPGAGQNDQSQMVAIGFEEESLQCFRCDLGFWDACYTTETQCSSGERCYTGRGKAVGILDVKVLGCMKAEECRVEEKVELYTNNTLFVMTKHCCDTHFCNSAHKHQPLTGLHHAALFLAAWCVTGVSR